MALAARTVVELTPYSSAMLRSVSPGSTVCTLGGLSWTGVLAAGIACARPSSGDGTTMASPTMLSQEKNRRGLNRPRAPGHPETRIVMGRILLVTSARRSRICLIQPATKRRIYPAYLSCGNTPNSNRNFGRIAGMSTPATPPLEAQELPDQGITYSSGLRILVSLCLHLTLHSRRGLRASASWPGLGRWA